VDFCDVCQVGLSRGGGAVRKRIGGIANLLFDFNLRWAGDNNFKSTPKGSYPTRHPYILATVECFRRRLEFVSILSPNDYGKLLEWVSTTQIQKCWFAVDPIRIMYAGNVSRDMTMIDSVKYETDGEQYGGNRKAPTLLVRGHSHALTNIKSKHLPLAMNVLSGEARSMSLLSESLETDSASSVGFFTSVIEATTA